MLLTHVTFGEETKDFLHALSLEYRRLSLLVPTIIIGDLKADPTDHNSTGPFTATNMAVRDTMHQAGLADLTAGLTGTLSHYPPITPIRPAYAHPALTRTVRVHKAAHGDLLPRARATDPSTSTESSPTYPQPPPPCPTTPSHPHCGSWPGTTTAPGTGITGPYKPSCTALMREQSPPPRAGKKHQEWHTNRKAAAAEEHERYGRKDTLYRSLR